LPITVRLVARRAALLRLLILACLAAAVGRAFAADKIGVVLMHSGQGVPGHRPPGDRRADRRVPFQRYRRGSSRKNDSSSRFQNFAIPTVPWPAVSSLAGIR